VPLFGPALRDLANHVIEAARDRKAELGESFGDTEDERELARAIAALEETMKTPLPAQPDYQAYPIRVCVLIDVNVDTPHEAYRKVKELLDTHIYVSGNGFDGWESSDSDWYGPDGNALSEAEINAARLGVLNNESGPGEDDVVSLFNALQPNEQAWVVRRLNIIMQGVK